jgi:hypothetical protein
MKKDLNTVTTIKTVSPRQIQREKMKEDRRRHALVHMNKRIKDLEVRCVNSNGSLYEKEKMRNSINFLSQVRDTTLYNLDTSLGLKPRQPKHRRVVSEVDNALEVDQAFATIGQAEQPDMSFLV